jgi:hypothetical protein
MSKVPITPEDFTEITSWEDIEGVADTPEAFLTELVKHTALFIKPKSFKPITGSFWLFEGATHFILSEAKEGKTTFVKNELEKIKKKVVIFDGDSNGQEMTEDLGANIQWLQPTDPDKMLDIFITQITAGVDFSDYVFVIDSMQNFTNERDMDSNKGILEIMMRLKKLTATGATLVVLHHVTVTKDGEFKAKGNQQGIYSSADIIYSFFREDGLTAIRSRINSIPNDTELGYGRGLTRVTEDEL